MKYIIVHWFGLEDGYKILHYSHSWTDAEKRFKHYQEMYGESVQFLVDAYTMQSKEAKDEFMNILARLKKNETK